MFPPQFILWEEKSSWLDYTPWYTRTRLRQNREDALLEETLEWVHSFVGCLGPLKETLRIELTVLADETISMLQIITELATCAEVTQNLLLEAFSAALRYCNCPALSSEALEKRGITLLQNYRKVLGVGRASFTRPSSWRELPHLDWRAFGGQLLTSYTSLWGQELVAWRSLHVDVPARQQFIVPIMGSATLYDISSLLSRLQMLAHSGCYFYSGAPIEGTPSAPFTTWKIPLSALRRLFEFMSTGSPQTAMSSNQLTEAKKYLTRLESEFSRITDPLRPIFSRYCDRPNGCNPFWTPPILEGIRVAATYRGCQLVASFFEDLFVLALRDIDQLVGGVRRAFQYYRQLDAFPSLSRVLALKQRLISRAALVKDHLCTVENQEQSARLRMQDQFRIEARQMFEVCWVAVQSPMWLTMFLDGRWEITREELSKRRELERSLRQEMKALRQQIKRASSQMLMGQESDARSVIEAAERRSREGFEEQISLTPPIVVSMENTLCSKATLFVANRASPDECRTAIFSARNHIERCCERAQRVSLYTVGLFPTIYLPKEFDRDTEKLFLERKGYPPSAVSRDEGMRFQQSANRVLNARRTLVIHYQAFVDSRPLFGGSIPAMDPVAELATVSGLQEELFLWLLSLVELQLLRQSSPYSPPARQRGASKVTPTTTVVNAFLLAKELFAFFLDPSSIKQFTATCQKQGKGPSLFNCGSSRTTTANVTKGPAAKNQKGGKPSASLQAFDDRTAAALLAADVKLLFTYVESVVTLPQNVLCRLQRKAEYRQKFSLIGWVLQRSPKMTSVAPQAVPTPAAEPLEGAHSQHRRPGTGSSVISRTSKLIFRQLPSEISLQNLSSICRLVYGAVVSVSWYGRFDALVDFGSAGCPTIPENKQLFVQSATNGRAFALTVEEFSGQSIPSSSRFDDGDDDW